MLRPDLSHRASARREEQLFYVATFPRLNESQQTNNITEDERVVNQTVNHIGRGERYLDDVKCSIVNGA